MEKDIKKLKNCMYELKIKLSSEEVETYFNSAYTQINKSVQIPGFRKGKAPRDILKKYYEGVAKQQVIDSVVPKYYRKVIQEADIEPVSEPTLTNLNFTSESSLFFKIKVPVRPEIKLNKYKGIKLIKKKIQVENKEVQDILDRLREQHAEFQPVKSGKVQKGNYVICDILCKLDGEVIENKKNVRLPIKEEFPIPELIKGLEGAEPGEEKVIPAVLPKGIYEDKYVGKKAKFYVNIHEIKEKILPELNDDFAKQAGEFDKLQDLENKVRQDIKEYKTRQQRRDLENQLLDKLLKYNKFEVPEALVKKEEESLVKQTKQNLISRGATEEQIKSYEAGAFKDIKKEAKRRVKTYFLLNSIGVEENIQVSDEEIQSEIKNLANSTRQSPEEFKKYLDKNKLLNNLISEIRVKKIIDFLLHNAKVK